METGGVLRELRRFDWSSLEWSPGLLCLPAIAIALLTGIGAGHPFAALVAAGGAQCVGFGSFQKPLGGLRAGPMILATLGTALSATVGEVVARDFPLLLSAAILWAFCYGMSGAISSPASWVGQQCCIFLVISSAVPGTFEEAAMRGLGVLAGGALQTAVVSAGWLVLPPARSAIPDPQQNPSGWQSRAVRSHLGLHSSIFRYALRLAATAGVSVFVYHKLGFLNAYWVPMTTIIILKPDPLLTHVRAISRLLGTLIGGGLATVLAFLIRPAPLSLVLVILAFIYAAYALQNVNYGLFAVFLTGYIVFLLAVGRLPESFTIYHRIVSTAIGGALAMLSYAGYIRSEEHEAPEKVAA